LLTFSSAAGLKAALHNPNVSDEAKENVSHHLAELTSPPHTSDGKDPTRVSVCSGWDTTRSILTLFSAAGLKAALHNPNVSDETKEHLQERLDDMN
jgi:hypothetical protein